MSLNPFPTIQNGVKPLHIATKPVKENTSKKGFTIPLQFHLKLPFQPNNSFLLFARSKHSQSIEIFI